jgi:hypothetical protein
MASMPDAERLVTVGIDSHKDIHVAAAVDQVGRIVGTTAAPTSVRGYAQLERWARGLGPVERFGVEGPAATPRAWPAGLSAAATRSWRSTGPTGSSVGGVASPTRSTPKQRPAPRSQARTSRPQGRQRHGGDGAGVAGGAPLGGESADPGRKPARAAWSSPHPTNSAASSAAWHPTGWSRSPPPSARRS